MLLMKRTPLPIVRRPLLGTPREAYHQFVSVGGANRGALVAQRAWKRKCEMALECPLRRLDVGKCNALHQQSS